MSTIKGIKINGGFPFDLGTEVDNTLTEEGLAADAKKVGDEIADLKSAISKARGLSAEAKTAILACFAHTAWIDDDGQNYYGALEEALYPPADLRSISAIFTQGQVIVYDSDSLDVLKQYLVVQANYDDGSSATVSEYTLSGTLLTGTSTITVTWSGKSTTFDVIVTHATTQYNISNVLTHCSNSNSATKINEEAAYSGTLSASFDHVLSNVTVTMGGVDITSTAYNSSTGEITIASVTGDIVITAVAIVDVGWQDGVAYDIEWGDTKQAINSAGEVIDSTQNLDRVSPLLPCYGASAIRPSSKPYGNFIYYYDENENFLTRTITPTDIENPMYHPVPRDAYYARMQYRETAANRANITITPYLFTKLTEETVYALNTHYVLDYDANTESTGAISKYALCVAAKKLQTSLYARSWVYFYDSEKTKIGEVIRSGSATQIEIPEGTYYIALNPNLYENGNSNNPWVMFTE